MPSTQAELRIAVVGNSHIGALRKAWSSFNRSSAPFATMTFFGAMSESFEALQADSEGLLAADGSELQRRFEGTSGGLCRVDYADYDAMLFVGLGLPYRDFAAKFRAHTTWDLAPVYPKSQLISGSMLQAVVMAQMSHRPLARIAAMLSKARPAIPVFTLAQPCPPEKILAASVFLDRSLFETGGAAALYQKFVAFNQSYAESFGADFIPQAESTWAYPGITQDRFNQNFVTIGGTTHNRDDDFSHMNQDYGAVMLHHVRAAMAGIGLVATD